MPLAIIEFLPKVGSYYVHAAKIAREGIPIYLSSTIVRATGKEFVETAVIASVDKNGKPIKDTEVELDVDTICLSVGLRPQTKLTEMVGCEMVYIPELGGFVPVHDSNMETSIGGFYIAGDLAGIEEASTAIEEGRLAGVAAAQSLGYCKNTEASSCKMEISKRLDHLRLGPFGEFRNNAKKELIRRAN